MQPEDSVKRVTESNKTGVLIIGGLFFVFGFVTWINGALIPFLMIACELTHLQAYLVTLAFYIAYTVMALPMSLVLRRTGYQGTDWLWGWSLWRWARWSSFPPRCSELTAYFSAGCS